ncbi:monocarboxylate transporter 12-like [Clytia hemisphaerica]|uniref:monocarboxylate transporter 12-like n=1 Tax=Clytia hemisphaerica TaxID=252671 RepID=UPI0034D4381E
MCGSGIILSAHLQNIYHLYLSFGVLLGVGSALLYTPTVVMVGRWFDKYQALVTTLVIAGAPVGSLIFNPLMEKMMEDYPLRLVMRIYGIAYLIISFVCSFGYLPFTQRLIRKENQESATGTTNKVDIGFKFRKKLLKNKAFWLFTVCRFFAIFAFYVPLFHLIKYATKIGISSSTASLMMMVWSACNICGRLSFGAFIARNRSKVLITFQTAMFLCGVVSAAAYFADNTWSLFLYCCVYGMLDGSNIGLASLVTIDLTSPLDLGAAWGIQQTINGVPTIAGPVLIGAMNDAKLLSANYMFTFTGGTFILGSIFMNFARITHNRTRQSVIPNTELKDVYNTDQNESLDKSHLQKDVYITDQNESLDESHLQKDVYITDQNESLDERSLQKEVLELDSQEVNSVEQTIDQLGITQQNSKNKRNEFSFENKIFYMDVSDI